MSAIEGYFVNIVSDFEHLLTAPVVNQNIADNRIASLAMRIFGGFVMLAAVSTFISSVATFAVSPITSFVGIQVAIIIAVIAHDIIKMGDNLRRICDAAEFGTKPQPSFLHQLAALGQAVVDVVPAAWYEAQHGIPYIFRRTIILDPVIRFLSS